MQVIRKQEKEPRLKDFIAAGLKDAVAGPSRCLVVARSVDSPVMRALAAFAGELQQGGHELRVIISMLETSDARLGLSGCPLLIGGRARWMRAARLADAHEFLVIGSSTSWTGDSMRRDPDKRDAFEAYVNGCELAAGRGARSFERLWSLSEPVSRSRLTPAKSSATQLQAAAGPIEASAGAAEVAAAANSPEAALPPVPGATRH